MLGYSASGRNEIMAVLSMYVTQQLTHAYVCEGVCRRWVCVRGVDCRIQRIADRGTALIRTWLL
jgi:hypothetical protein